VARNKAIVAQKTQADPNRKPSQKSQTKPAQQCGMFNAKQSFCARHDQVGHPSGPPSGGPNETNVANGQIKHVMFALKWCGTKDSLQDAATIRAGPTILRPGLRLG